MAIVLPQGFEIGSKEPIDSRLVLTKAEMATKLKGEMPDNYLCVCKDDGKLYIWNSQYISTETGRFKPYEEVMDISGALDNPELKPEIESSLSNLLPNALKETISEQSKDSGLIVDENGNIQISVNNDHLKIVDNQIDLDISVIQANY